MATNNSPDLLYQQPRESLLILEDTRLYFLLQAVANYYQPRNDQSQWGAMLRGVARELARLDYDYQYDIAAKEPQYLTPPDIKRRWASPLGVRSAYPYPAQFDKGDFTGFSSSANPVGYRDMLVDLLKAYGEGATLKSLADVIYAYTGKTIAPVELYALIGTSIYDESFRNTVAVSVDIGSASSGLSLVQLQEVVANLYAAMDLAKPAHVGLQFSTVFVEEETVAQDIVDTLTVIVELIEDAPIDPMLWIAPILDVKHPKTTLAAFGRRLQTTISQPAWTALQSAPADWDAGATYPRGTLVQYSAGSPPFPAYQQYRALKRTTGNAPASSPAYWKALRSPSVWQAYYPLASGMYTVGIAPWQAGGDFYTGQFVLDPATGNLQVAYQGGTAGPSVAFNDSPLGFTDDGSVVWQNLGPNYLTDPAKWIQVVDSTGDPTGETANWNAAQPMGLVAPREASAWEIKSDILGALEYT